MVVDSLSEVLGADLSQSQIDHRSGRFLRVHVRLLLGQLIVSLY